jgi:hypothetical protein
VYLGSAARVRAQPHRPGAASRACPRRSGISGCARWGHSLCERATTATASRTSRSSNTSWHVHWSARLPQHPKEALDHAARDGKRSQASLESCSNARATRGRLGALRGLLPERELSDSGTSASQTATVAAPTRCGCLIGLARWSGESGRLDSRRGRPAWPAAVEHRSARNQPAPRLVHGHRSVGSRPERRRPDGSRPLNGTPGRCQAVRCQPRWRERRGG